MQCWFGIFVSFSLLRFVKPLPFCSSCSCSIRTLIFLPRACVPVCVYTATTAAKFPALFDLFFFRRFSVVGLFVCHCVVSWASCFPCCYWAVALMHLLKSKGAVSHKAFLYLDVHAYTSTTPVGRTLDPLNAGPIPHLLHLSPFPLIPPPLLMSPSRS